jgi:hypothetical protein
MGFQGWWGGIFALYIINVVVSGEWWLIASVSGQSDIIDFTIADWEQLISTTYLFVLYAAIANEC